MPDPQDPPATVHDTSPISLPPAEVLCVVCGALTDGDPADLRCAECRAHGNVNPAALLPDAPPPTAAEQSVVSVIEALPTQQPTHVRVGGQAGLRVQHFEGGVTKRTRAGQFDPAAAASADHTLVPNAVLAEVAELLTAPEHQRGAAGSSGYAKLSQVRELLAPWLPVVR